MNYKIIFTAFSLVTLFTFALAHNKEKCDAPSSDTGLCRAAFSAVTFKDKKCTDFIYGGCGATPNYFDSIKECEAACLK